MSLFQGTNLTLLLTGGASPHSGQISVSLPGGGGLARVLDNLWTIEEGNVVCRHLGYSGADEIFTSDHVGPAEGELYFATTVECSGEETNLLDCYLVAAGGERQVQRHVAVTCRGSRTARSTDSQLRENNAPSDSATARAHASSHRDSKTRKPREMRSSGQNDAGEQNSGRHLSSKISHSVRERPDFKTLSNTATTGSSSHRNRWFATRVPGKISSSEGQYKL